VCVFKFSKPPATSPTPPSDAPNKCVITTINLKCIIYTIFTLFCISFHRSNSLSQKNIQKLRTLRHPFVVTYVDSIELDEASVLVTESCRPLETWLKEYRSRMTDHSPEGHAAVLQYKTCYSMHYLVQFFDQILLHCVVLFFIVLK
jgi:hypothetical protein